MISIQKIATVILSVLAVHAIAEPSLRNPDNPYQGIVERNVFALRRATPVPTNGPPPILLTSVTLTGTTTVLGKRHALLTIQAADKTTHSCILAEGERDGDIEIVRVDVENGRVEAIQKGTLVALFFQHRPQ